MQSAEPPHDSAYGGSSGIALVYRSERHALICQPASRRNYYLLPALAGIFYCFIRQSLINTALSSRASSTGRALRRAPACGKPQTVAHEGGRSGEISAVYAYAEPRQNVVV